MPLKTRVKYKKIGSETLGFGRENPANEFWELTAVEAVLKEIDAIY